MPSAKKHRFVQTYKDHFEKFFSKQDNKVKDKIIWTLELIEDLDHIPKTYLDFLGEKLYEIRVKHGSNIFRIFCFFDDNKLVILMNGFQKKTQRTPKSELKRAKAIMKDYYTSKSK